MPITPQNNDVLFGRGHRIMVHPGNRLLRSKVEAQKQNFLSSHKMLKRQIAYDIVNEIYEAGGRFLMEDPTSKMPEKVWICVDLERATSKVMHRLREKKKGSSGERAAQSRVAKGENNVPPSASVKDAGAAAVDSPETKCKINDHFDVQPQQASNGDQRMTVGAIEDSFGSPSGPGACPSLEAELILRPVVTEPNAQPSNYHGRLLPQQNFESDRSSPGFVPPILPNKPANNNFDIQQDANQLFGESEFQPSQPAVNDGQQITGGDAFGSLCLPQACASSSELSLILQQFISAQPNAQPSNHHNGSDQSPPCLAPDILQSNPAVSLNGTLSDTNIRRREGHSSGQGGHSPQNQFFYCPGAKDAIERFPLSLAEFLESGRSSGRILLSWHQGEEANAPANELENATRLALLLTCSFANRLPEVADPALIRLDDFSIDSERDPTDARAPKSPGPDPSRPSVGASRPDDPSPGPALLRMDFFPPTESNVRPRRKLSESEAMPVLGRLLYSVFSRGESPPPDLLTEARNAVRESTAHVRGRESKLFRTAGVSVFSKLVERGTFPVSICRLISDMVDTGRASHPFRSSDDVIQDLDQMIRRPGTFLHDSRSRGVPPQPAFDQTCHGREAEVANLRSVVDRMERRSPTSGRLEAMFLRGIAGSGKSHLVRAFEKTLGSEWIVIRAKFERVREHASMTIVSSMFDQLIVYLIKMKESGRPSDATYCQQVSGSILNVIGWDTLPSLVDFLPSLPLLFDGLYDETSKQTKAEVTEFQLIYSISKFIQSLLESDRLIMICCDDLQWGDKTALSIVSEVLVNIGSFKHVCSRCLFVGMFRHEEIDDTPFAIQYSYLQMMTNNINTAEMKLSNLSKKDIGDMLMAELGLPWRFVTLLADVVHKKTSGHAFFTVELLNSLLRSSVVAYNLQKRRYDWDADVINMIPTGDGVAGLIASNVKSLPPVNIRILQILACFGIQTDISLLQYLESFQEGIIRSLDTYVDMGILDRAGPIVIFTHDLIQQEVYEIAPMVERQKLHLEIGMFLGELATVDMEKLHSACSIDRVTTALDHIQLDDQEFYAGRSITSSLISLACDQIDSIGLDEIREEGQRVKFSTWNLYAGRQGYSQSNSRAALYYFSRGIAFLGRECWHANYARLTLALSKGAVMASFALGEPDAVTQYAETITSNAKFEDSLDIQPFVLRSLSQLGKHHECISKGVEILHQHLNFNVLLNPTPESVMNAIDVVDKIASEFSMDQIMNLCDREVDFSVHLVFEIVDAIFASCYASSSPFMPLVACATIQFSLQHGICHPACCTPPPGSLAIFAMLKIFNKGDYSGGRYWADVVRKIGKKQKTTNVFSETLALLAIDIWFMSPRVIAQKLLNNHQSAMRKGRFDVAMVSLQTGWRFRLLGGEQLSQVYQSSEDRLRLMAKHSQYAAKCALLDSILLMELTGNSGDYFSAFEGTICNMNDLQDSAKSSKDMHLLQSSHVFNVLVEYWRGNYSAAEESSRQASIMFPASKMPTIYLIYHTFFRGLILFQLYRICGDQQRLNDGKGMMDRLEEWARVSMAIFENKWLLLKAEYYYSIYDSDQALQMYQESIKSARDYGNIHELAMAHELLGKYHLERGCREDSKECFRNAHVYYTQWGAIAVAEKILRKYNLELDSQASPLQNQKHPREPD